MSEYPYEPTDPNLNKPDDPLDQSTPSPEPSPWAEVEPESPQEWAVRNPAEDIYGQTPDPHFDWSTYQLPEEMPEEEEEDPGPTGWQVAKGVIWEIGETVLLTLIIFFVIQLFVRNFRVDGQSMEGNLHHQQYLIVDKVSYSDFLIDYIGVGGPQRGDVIVFKPPNRPGYDYVKRVIGLPGETVEVINGTVFINGEQLEEPFQPRVGTYSTPATVVPDDQVYVLGDNRNNSNDSHSWGPLPMENIVGRAWISYWPPSQWGYIPRDRPTDDATLLSLFENLVPSANAEGE